MAYGSAESVIVYLEDIDEYLGRDHTTGVLLHHREHLLYGGRGKPHTQTDIVQPGHLEILLFGINVHQQYQPMELKNAIGLRLGHDMFDLGYEKRVKGFPIDPELIGHTQQKIKLGLLDLTIDLCKLDHFGKYAQFFFMCSHYELNK